MIWLEAALGFALTMLIFATMVSVIVEAGMRVGLTREGGFRRMLEQLFDEIIEPRLTNLVAQAPTESRKDFIDKLARNPAMPKVGTGRWAIFRKWLVPRETTSMTVMQFAERLADTEVGQTIAKQAEDQVDALVKDMAQKFENVGAAATEYYTRRAAMISMLVAIFFAYAGNIDSIRLFKALINNQQLTTSIIARSEDVKKNHLEQQVAMEKLLDDIKKAGAGEEIADADTDLKKLRETAGQLKTDLADLASQGLPVTYELFPACPADSTDMKCDPYRRDLREKICALSPDNKKYGEEYATLDECIAGMHALWRTIWHEPIQGIGWFFSVLLSGLLIGLGAPFWYNLVSSLTRVVQLARTMGVGTKPKQKESAEEPAAVVQRTDQPRNPVEAFTVAAQAMGVSSSGGGRIPLSPSGEALKESGQ